MPFAPVVFVGEAPARPAHVRHLDRLERGNDVVANAAGVWNRRVGADPDPFINAVAEVLGELAENVAVDLRAGLGHINGQFHLLRAGKRRVRAYHHENETEKKGSDDE